MREIKFRAWLKEDEKMANVETMDFTDKSIQYLKKSEINNAYILRRENFVDVELMQYTGLKDKNGTEIYENDIVKFIVLEGYGEHADQFEYIDKVEYYISEFELRQIGLKLSDEGIIVIEIIGNVYENPELLEENK